MHGWEVRAVGHEETRLDKLSAEIDARQPVQER
jgi:hypothetical protein